MPYAAGTTVSAERSKAEIETILKKYGAKEFVSGWTETEAAIVFTAHSRRIRFTLKIPPIEQFKKGVKWNVEREFSDDEATRMQDQEVRRRWRALGLVIKAKLEAVESQVKTFEEEFLSYIVEPNSGRTVGEILIPRLDNLYATGKMPALLGPVKDV